MRVWKNVVIFYIGGLAYMTLEILWRGWSHWSMFLLGGLCFWLIDRLRRRRLSFLAQMGLGVAVITVLELACGLLVNRVLALAVWDYSAMPLNLWGQICLPYTLLWVPVSALALLAGGFVHQVLFSEPQPPRHWI